MNRIKLLILCCWFGIISVSAAQTEGGVNCDAVNFIGSEGQISLNNLNAISERIEYFGAATNYQTVVVCDGNCASTQTISDLAGGIYIVKLLMIGEAGALCFREEEIMVTEDTGNICDSQGGDADGDGICAINDCDDSNFFIGATQIPGTPCDDGDPTTNNDIIQADGCTCQGENTTVGGTADCAIVTFSGGAGQFTVNNLVAQSERVEYFGAATNYQTIGVCDGNCLENQSVTSLSAGSYIVKLLMIGNDGTFCYREEEVIVTPTNGGPCDENGGDADGDGICADIDCDDTRANIGAAQLPGTPCNDGNPATANDAIQADGCTCLGVIDGNLCEQRGGDADGDGICADIDCDDTRADIGIAQLPGTSCDDENPATANDVIQADGCTCLGEIDASLCDERGGDADGDGVCADIDCDDTSAEIGIAQAPGTACDDGNPNTDNDVIQADGCMCLGDVVDCEAVTFEGGAGTITVSNLTAPSVMLNIIGAATNFELINICNGACNTQEVISNLAAGSYSVKLLLDGAGGCYREEDVLVTPAAALSSSDRTATEFYLNGFANLQNIELQWVHTDERPKSYFVLEKSIDGQLFEPVQVIKSQDIGTNVAAYKELDEQPQTGTNYYRIGTAFSTGDFTYSKIVQVDFTPLDHFDIFPNPINAQGALFINLSDFAGKSANLIIYNGLGQPVQSMQVDKVGDSPIRLKLEDLADGVYSIGVNVLGKRLQARRFIVQRL